MISGSNASSTSLSSSFSSRGYIRYNGEVKEPKRWTVRAQACTGISHFLHWVSFSRHACDILEIYVSIRSSGPDPALSVGARMVGETLSLFRSFSDRFLDASRGRNVEGQCGIESSVICTRPTTVTELNGAPVSTLRAGKLNSAAIVCEGRHSDGEVWTWGCGKSGKLGQGNSDAMHNPSR